MGGEVIIMISLFASVFGMVAMIVTNRNKERMALIEKGVDASLFYARNQKNGYWALKAGALLVGIALGLLFGTLLANSHAMDEEPAYFSMIALFGGLGLIGSFFISRKMEKKDAEQEANKLR